MALWLSSGAFKTRNLSELLVQASEWGLYNIELSSGMIHDPNAVSRLRRARETVGLDFLVHNYFPPPRDPFVLNIASLDPKGLSRTKSFAVHSIELAWELGAPFYSIHAGFAAAIRPEHLGRPARLAEELASCRIDRDAAYNVMLETTRYLADRAAQRGMDLLIENNVVSPVFIGRMPNNPLLLTEAEEIERFFSEVDRPNVGLLLDVAHARVSANAQAFSLEEFIDRVSGHVRCLHLSDNNGVTDTNQPIGKDAWFRPWLKQFCHCEIVIEVYRLKSEEMREQISIVQSFTE